MTVTKNHTISGGEGEPLNFFEEGTVDRNYPSFAISNFIYQGLVRSWSSFHQYAVNREQILRGEGVRFLNDGRDIETEPSRNIERIIAQTELVFREEDVLALVPDGDLEGMHLEN